MVDKSDMINKTAQHKVFGAGLVTRVDDAANTVTVTFKGKPHNFPYPDAFEKFLTFGDETIHRQLLNRIKLSKEMSAIFDLASHTEQMAAWSREFQNLHNSAGDDDLMYMFDYLYEFTVSAYDEACEDTQLDHAIFAALNGLEDALSENMHKDYVNAFKWLYNGYEDSYFEAIERYIEQYTEKNGDFTSKRAYLDIICVLEWYASDDGVYNGYLRQLSEILNEHAPESAFCAHVNYLLTVFPHDNEKIKALQRIIELDKDWDYAYGYLGDIYYRQKEWEKALACYETTISLCDYWKTDKMYFCMAYCCSKNNYAKAVEYYKKCLAITPDYKYANNNLGHAYRMIKEYDLALQYLDKSIALGTDGSYPFRNKLTVLIKSGRKDEALLFAQENPSYFKSKYYQGVLRKLAKGQGIDIILKDTEKTEVDI